MLNCISCCTSGGSALVLETSASGDVATPSVWTPIDPRVFSTVLITPKMPMEPVRVLGFATM